jgi:hypothetical protein
MNIDIDGVDWIADRPMTDAYNEIRESNLCVETKFLSHLIVEAFPPSKNNKISGVEMFSYHEDFTRSRSFDVTKAVFGKRLTNILSKANICSEGDETHKAFHKVRSKTGIVWQIDRELAFDWLKNKKYTTATVLTEIADENFYNFFDTL